MICKMGKNKRSAFIIFLDERKNEVPEWKMKSIRDLVPLCTPLWENLSSEKKEEYKEKYRQEKSLRVEEERQRVERELELFEQERKEVRKEWRFDENGNKLADEDGNKLADDAMGDRYTGVYILQKGFFSNSSGIFGGATVHALIIGGALWSCQKQETQKILTTFKGGARRFTF